MFRAPDAGDETARVEAPAALGATGALITDGLSRPRRWRRLGRAVAAGLLVGGVVASMLAASWWSGRVRSDDEEVLDRRADDLAATVASLIKRQVDVTDGALNLVRVAPDTTSTATFQAWFELVQESGRYPGTASFGYQEVVPADQGPAKLAEFFSQMAARYADTPEVLEAMAATYDVSLDPSSSTYCLPTAFAGGLEAIKAMAELPVEYRKLDLCATPVRDVIGLARDTGEVAVGPYGLPNLFHVTSPNYGAGGVPATREARRANFLGAMGAIVDGRELLLSAAGVHEGVWLELAWVQPGGIRQALATTSDELPSGGSTRTVAVDADGLWSLRVTATASGSGLSAGVQGWTVFGIGALVSVLLFALLETLTRGRERALRVVDKRTSELRHLALHDSLTGLPNRTLIVDRTDHLLQRARRHGQDCAALFIDLDGFKEINDTLGHDSGDTLLQAVAMRLERVLRETDTVGRMGGDEFVVLLDEGAITPGPEVVADRILEILREPIRLTETGVTFPITASIGVAIRRTGTASDLLRDADVALYQAKAEGRNRYVVFRPEMQEAVQDRLTLGLELRDALDAGELFIEYQPTFNIESTEIRGVEALVRWRHPERGVVPPLDFIPLAEETGLIGELGAWVLREACTQMAAWHRDGYPLSVNVNVSPRQLDRPEFGSLVSDVLHETGLRPDLLVLEITESALMADAAVIRTRLAELRQLGVKIAIDDFGTGYSSLAYLRQFPVDAIKIDRSFLTDLGRSADAAALMHSLIRLGQNLGLETLAEGIEHDAQLQYLRAERCDSGQGYLVARPLEAHAAISFLRRFARTANTTT